MMVCDRLVSALTMEVGLEESTIGIQVMLSEGYIKLMKRLLHK